MHAQGQRTHSAQTNIIIPDCVVVCAGGGAGGGAGGVESEISV